MKLYHDVAEKYGFKPKPDTDEAEIMRYLMVTGLVPVTIENIALVKEEFYIDADKMPSDLVEKILARAKKSRRHWEWDEEFEEDELERIRDSVDGAWIKDGVIRGVKIIVDRKVRMNTIYLANMKMSIE